MMRHRDRLIILTITVLTSCAIAGFNQEWGRQSRRYTESAFIQSANSRIDSQRSRYHFPSFASENNSNNDAQLQSFDYELKRRTKDQWIGGKEMKQIIAAEEQQMAIQQQAKQRREMIIARDESRKIKPIDFKSIISYTDANTLEIEFPATGITSSSVAAGVFAAVWFGAITPATLSMLSAGVAPLLFITPFWIAGAAVAKTALYDPFKSSKLTIGKYLWTLESQFLKRSKTNEGPTESLRGASIDVGMVVNNVPIYELRLFTSERIVAKFGQGFDVAELEHLRDVINGHIDRYL